MSAIENESVKPIRSMLKSKLHRATITHADIEYEGSLTMDRLLMEAADIIEWEEVHVWNVTRGSRVRTYAMQAEAGSGVVCANGAVAHLIRPGDIVIIATFTQLTDAQARKHHPRIVLLGPENRIKRTVQREIPGPHKGHD
jgi:aspartate 1-decarboxylase